MDRASIGKAGGERNSNIRAYKQNWGTKVKIGHGMFRKVRIPSWLNGTTCVGE